MLARLVGILHVLWLVYEVYLLRLSLKYNASNIAISTLYLKIYLPSNFIQKSWDLIWDLPITEEGVPPHFRRVRGGSSGRKEGGKFRTVVWPGRGGKGSGVCKRAIGSGRVERWCINQATIVRAIQPTDRRQFFPTDRRRPFPGLLGGIVMYSTIRGLLLVVTEDFVHVTLSYVMYFRFMDDANLHASDQE